MGRCAYFFFGTLDPMTSVELTMSFHMMSWFIETRVIRTASGVASGMFPHASLRSP